MWIFGDILSREKSIIMKKFEKLFLFLRNYRFCHLYILLAPNLCFKTLASPVYKITCSTVPRYGNTCQRLLRPNAQSISYYMRRNMSACDGPKLNPKIECFRKNRDYHPPLSKYCKRGGPKKKPKGFFGWLTSMFSRKKKAKVGPCCSDASGTSKKKGTSKKQREPPKLVASSVQPQIIKKTSNESCNESDKKPNVLHKPKKKADNDCKKKPEIKMPCKEEKGPCKPAVSVCDPRGVPCIYQDPPSPSETTTTSNNPIIPPSPCKKPSPCESSTTSNKPIVQPSPSKKPKACENKCEPAEIPCIDKPCPTTPSKTISKSADIKGTPDCQGDDKKKDCMPILNCNLNITDCVKKAKDCISKVKDGNNNNNDCNKEYELSLIISECQIKKQLEPTCTDKKTPKCAQESCEGFNNKIDTRKSSSSNNLLKLGGDLVTSKAQEIEKLKENQNQLTSSPKYLKTDSKNDWVSYDKKLSKLENKNLFSLSDSKTKEMKANRASRKPSETENKNNLITGARLLQEDTKNDLKKINEEIERTQIKPLIKSKEKLNDNYTTNPSNKAIKTKDGLKKDIEAISEKLTNRELSFSNLKEIIIPDNKKEVNNKLPQPKNTSIETIQPKNCLEKISGGTLQKFSDRELCFSDLKEVIEDNRNAEIINTSPEKPLRVGFLIHYLKEEFRENQIKDEKESKKQENNLLQIDSNQNLVNNKKEDITETRNKYQFIPGDDTNADKNVNKKSQELSKIQITKEETDDFLNERQKLMESKKKEQSKNGVFKFNNATEMMNKIEKSLKILDNDIMKNLTNLSEKCYKNIANKQQIKSENKKSDDIKTDKLNILNDSSSSFPQIKQFSLNADTSSADTNISQNNIKNNLVQSNQSVNNKHTVNTRTTSKNNHKHIYGNSKTNFGKDTNSKRNRDTDLQKIKYAKLRNKAIMYSDICSLIPDKNKKHKMIKSQYFICSRNENKNDDGEKRNRNVIKKPIQKTNMFDNNKQKINTKSQSQINKANKFIQTEVRDKPMEKENKIIQTEVQTPARIYNDHFERIKYLLDQEDLKKIEIISTKTHNFCKLMMELVDLFSAYKMSVEVRNCEKAIENLKMKQSKIKELLNTVSSLENSLHDFKPKEPSEPINNLNVFDCKTNTLKENLYNDIEKHNNSQIINFPKENNENNFNNLCSNSSHQTDKNDIEKLYKSIDNHTNSNDNEVDAQKRLETIMLKESEFRKTLLDLVVLLTTQDGTNEDNQKKVS